MHHLITLTVLMLRLVTRLRRDNTNCQFTMDRLYAMVMILNEDDSMLIAGRSKISSRDVRWLRMVYFQLHVLIIIVVNVARSSARHSVTSFIVRLSIRLRNYVHERALIITRQATISDVCASAPRQIVIQVGGLLRVRPIVKIARRAMEIKARHATLEVKRVIHFTMQRIKARGSVHRQIQLPLRARVNVRVLNFIALPTIQIKMEITIQRGILNEASAYGVPVLVIMTYAATRFRLVNLNDRVRARRFHYDGSIIPTPTQEATATQGTLIIRIVNEARCQRLNFIRRTIRRGTTRVTIFHPSNRINVARPALIRTFLCNRIRRHLLLAIIGANSAYRVKLLVMNFRLLCRVCQRILRANLCISARRLLTISRGLQRILAISFRVALIIGLHAKRLLRRLLRRNSLKNAVNE